MTLAHGNGQAEICCVTSIDAAARSYLATEHQHQVELWLYRSPFDGEAANAAK